MDKNRGEISSESNADGRTVKTKVPEVEIHVFRKGEGPIKIFKACLGGWDQDRLELRAILKEFGFESVFKYDPASGRGDRIYFNPDNGKSLTSYSDGSVVFLDGDPKAGPDVQEEKQSSVSEIEETSKPTRKYVTTKVPEVEIHLFRQGKGPIDVFKSSLGGWDQDLLEVRDILDKYGFKSIFAFNPESGRSVPICFNPKNGRSILPYEDGAVIFIDGEPKDSLIKPMTKILVGAAIITILITLVSMETPEWFKKLNFSVGGFHPWILACVVIVFTRVRKRTKDVLRNYGW